MPIERWNLYLDRTYRLEPWPWADRNWDTVNDQDLAALPHANSDFTRYAPNDGFGVLVPLGLPRELPTAKTRFAVYYTAQHLHVFLQADRPAPASPRLNDVEREDYSCIFQLEGHNRGIYFGCDDTGAHVSWARVFDGVLLKPEDLLNWPWDEERKDHWKNLGRYDARFFKTATGTTVAWRIPRTTLEPGYDGEGFRFTIGRRSQRTNELLSWASYFVWDSRAAELGKLILKPKPYDRPTPHAHRIDLELNTADDTAIVRITWADLWNNLLLTRQPDGTAKCAPRFETEAGSYGDFIHHYTLDTNGDEHTAPLADVTQIPVTLKEGDNRLDLMTGFGPPKTVYFKSHPGLRLIHPRVKPSAAWPSLPQLADRFVQWHASTESVYHGGGKWGNPAGNSVHNISHNGAFVMEPYALFCLYGERRPAYLDRVREMCERALAEQMPEGWFADKAVNTAPFNRFAGGAFDTGSAGEALMLGYRVLGDERYLVAGRRIIDAYRFYLTETNQNYAAFALWHLCEQYGIEPAAHTLDLAVYYCEHLASRAIDPSGVQDAHNFYGCYGGITLKGLAKLLAVLPESHAYYSTLRHLTFRMSNQALSRQQQSGRFAERNRRYLGYNSIAPLGGLFSLAHAIGRTNALILEPALLAGFGAAKGDESGLAIAMAARHLSGGVQVRK